MTLADFVVRTAIQFHAGAVSLGIAEPTADLPNTFVAMIRDLSTLHTAGGSQLRYLSPHNTMAPKPGWLTETFHHVGEAYLKRPPFGP